MPSLICAHKVDTLPEVAVVPVAERVIALQEGRQMSLFDTTDYEKQEKADAAMDAIREKFGAGAIRRAAFLKPGERASQKDTEKSN